MNKKIYFCSSVFVPSNFEGVIKVKLITLEEVKKIATKHKNHIKSYVGHLASAQYLNVDMDRGVAKLRTGQIWYGIRPKKRVGDKREVKELLHINEQNFTGFKMEVLQAN